MHLCHFETLLSEAIDRLAWPINLEPPEAGVLHRNETVFRPIARFSFQRPRPCVKTSSSFELLQKLPLRVGHQNSHDKVGNAAD